MTTSTTPAEAGTSDLPRKRNAAESRQRLLEAAQELFSERGFEATTVRQIGQHAGVDPTLIARYFGSKAALYLAALRGETEPASREPIDLRDPAVLRQLLDRIATRSATPTFYAAVRPHEDEDLQAAAMAIMEPRMLAPSEQAASGLDQSRLRAEVAVAALAGIVLSRSSHAFDVLAEASSADLAPLLADLVDSVLSG